MSWSHIVGQFGSLAKVRNKVNCRRNPRRRLDYEIPGYLDRLRVDIGRYLEEVPSTEDDAAS